MTAQQRLRRNGCAHIMVQRKKQGKKKKAVDRVHNPSPLNKRKRDVWTMAVVE